MVYGRHTRHLPPGGAMRAKIHTPTTIATLGTRHVELPLYRYVLQLACGNEITTDAPPAGDAEVTCGHTAGHEKSTVIHFSPERDDK